MELNTVMSAISTVGFPIAMCVGLLWYINKLTEKHKEETDQFTEALNKNTLVLQKLCDRMGEEREEQ